MGPAAGVGPGEPGAEGPKLIGAGREDMPCTANKIVKIAGLMGLVRIITLAQRASQCQESGWLTDKAGTVVGAQLALAPGFCDMKTYLLRAYVTREDNPHHIHAVTSEELAVVVLGVIIGGRFAYPPLL